MNEATTERSALKPGNSFKVVYFLVSNCFQDQGNVTNDIPPLADRVEIQNKEDDNDNEASAHDSYSNHAKPQEGNLKRQHSDASAIISSSHPNDIPSRKRRAKLDQPSLSNLDGSTLADSQEWEGKPQIVAQNEAFSEKDDDWVFDHTKIILQIGNDYFATASQQRESELKDLDHSTLDLTRIPRDHFCPKFKEGIISKAPESLSLEDVYLKKPNLISWDAEDEDSTSIADLVLQEAEVCETLKKHPHPNIVRYFGCLVEDDRIVGLVLGKYTSKLSDKLADSDPDERMRLYEGVERGVRHLHQIGLIHNDLNPANIMLDGTIPVIIDFDSCRPKGEKMGEKRGTFGWELEEAEIAVPENDFHGLGKLKEYILSGGKVEFDGE
ncbi:hypothetical protein IL306_004031 [Fusarium sp. DS 682]|nr:hypothetical protein IL306_004031 [Fusarium sp. DS 682]